MSQSNFQLGNQAAPSLRLAMQAAVLALVTNSSGSEPTDTFPFMLWADPAANQLKIRNEADSDWVGLLRLSDGQALKLPNHVSSVAGYQGAVSIQNILTALKSVDGAGSGLDADTVHGVDGADFYHPGNPAVPGLSQAYAEKKGDRGYSTNFTNSSNRSRFILITQQNTTKTQSGMRLFLDDVGVSADYWTGGQTQSIAFIVPPGMMYRIEPIYVGGRRIDYWQEIAL